MDCPLLLDSAFECEMMDKILKDGALDCSQEHVESNLYRGNRSGEVSLGSAESNPCGYSQHLQLKEMNPMPGLPFMAFYDFLIPSTKIRIFPQCKVSVSGLAPHSQYSLLMDIVSVDNIRYKWQCKLWKTGNRAEPGPPRCFCIHHDSPSSGEVWMGHPVSFHKIKLTNNTLDRHGHIILHSMHKYQPRFHIVETNNQYSLCWNGFAIFVFPEKVFITVYQGKPSSKVTQLKIDKNPFAKGFRINVCKQRKQAGLGEAGVSRTSLGYVIRHEATSSVVNPYPIKTETRGKASFIQRNRTQRLLAKEETQAPVTHK
ncbi:T-box transcription factor TBX6-like [Callorhinchus milii]|uniref:T-box transcription factor TBX6-like n=1 Tax=Callorhinchus milii TaxID=7868 RepID=UPI001C3F809A|nr:T-box transcription factor TBX6-like [Callorhinchus milii]